MRIPTALLVGSLLLSAGAFAQQPAPTPVPRAPVVVLDRDVLFATSRLGQRIADELDAASRALAEENRRIAEALEAEERSLTERRDAMEPEAFDRLARAFDEKVVALRTEQDAKARAFEERADRAQTRFFEQANPILIALAQETGALVILDRRIVIASAESVDITDLARERLDEAFGEDMRDAPARE
jgi:Skp family chaperone for outer membrane proteins